MIKVLHFVPALSNGGIESVLYNYISRMDKESISMDIAVFYGAEENLIGKEKFERLGCKVIPMKTLLSSPKEHLQEVKKIMNEGKYDIVHIHANSALRGIYGVVANKCGVKARILHAHCTGCDSLKEKLIHWASKVLFTRFCNYRYAVSKKAGKFFFGWKKYDLIPNAINLEKFAYCPESGDELRESMGIDCDEIVLGTIGRKVWVKNQVYIVKLAERMLKKNIKVKAVIVGGGGDAEKALIDEINRCDVKDSVIILGSTDKAECFYNMFDVCLLPSHHEGFSMVGIEAQACGCPCVFSDSIPRDVAVTEHVRFCPITDEAMTDWIKYIQELHKQGKGDWSDDVRAAGFDITTAATSLKNRYQEMTIYDISMP